MGSFHIISPFNLVKEKTEEKNRILGKERQRVVEQNCETLADNLKRY